MIRFNCDYSEGAHPKVLEKLSETNFIQTEGYGEDPYCRKAAGIIRKLCGRQDAGVHFFTGGTQVNFTVVSAALRPHQGALSADTGHINTHESGAVEATGHKVLPLESEDGKITAEQIRGACALHYGDESHEHMVQPGLVYLSNPTEIGTLYGRDELTAIREACREYGLFLYLDGARLGYGLAAPGNDLTLPDLARLCDAFTIGGTKVGALFGEALVIGNADLNRDFRYIMKQKGAMLAKGRLLGLQFLALLEDGLYFEISEQADRMAEVIRESCVHRGYGFLSSSRTNQQFPILPDDALKKLGEKYAFSYWKRIDGTHSAVRFCTSWATRAEDARSLARDMEGS